MEDNCWYELHGFLRKRINLKLDDKKILVNGDIVLEDFEGCAYEYVSRFMGECNRNQFNSGASELFYSEIKNYKEKILNAFENEYEYKFSNNFKVPSQFIDLSLEIPNAQIYYLNLFRIKWQVYKFLLDKLEEILKKRKSLGIKHQLARREDFNLNLINDQLDELRNLFIDQDLIIKSTKIDDFRAAFSGRKNRSRLVWTEDAHCLYVLINGLNENCMFRNVLTHGKWEIVIDIFNPEKRINGKPFYEKTTIMKSSPTAGKDYDSLVGPIIERIKILKQENTD